MIPVYKYTDICIHRKVTLTQIKFEPEKSTLA